MLFLSVILIDSVFKNAKSYYSQMLLEECNHIVTEKKMIRYINEDLEIYSDGSDEEPQKKFIHLRHENFDTSFNL